RNREGQVFYVHNRVASIAAVAMELKQLVPEARIEYAHGQMHGRDLEEVMIRFVNREIDVLVCTTIIESGIDIPTANTIFIADCDRFGLAELHQLRGRVGRYKHRAYCYLLLPLTRPLTDVASKRLRAIEDFSMLGAGFKIAMRDMEIRGVGNLLGREQSGHIATVGYEMYCNLLEQATAQLQKQSHPQPADAHLELKVGGHLPRSFIPSDRHRIEAYRRISRAAAPEDLAKVRQDLAEAYGRLPATTEVLLDLAAIRVGLGRVGAESLKLDPPDLVFTAADVRGLAQHLSSANGSVRIVDVPASGKPGTVYYRPPAAYLKEPPTLLAVLRKILDVKEPLEAVAAV
ncbi:MAG: helicase-related protein, partial [Phycisphaerae bacterium]|nr:helicase-related protein [Phycisphaerae bacterium]